MASRRPEEWMSSREACDYLGVVRTTLAGWVNDGKVPAYRFGRVYRFRKHELDALIDSWRVTPGDMPTPPPDPLLQSAKVTLPKEHG